jgi:hypothetical protein
MEVMVWFGIGGSLLAVPSISSLAKMLGLLLAK